MTDEEGSITDTYRFNAWGELLEKSGKTENPYLYTGEYYDEGTGLYYLRARYMNPKTGSFISMDTYQGNAYDPASLHKYTYAQNNLEMYNDPSRHSAISMSSVGMRLAADQMCSNMLRNLASMKLELTTLKNAAMIGMAVVCGTVLTDYLVKNYLSQVGAAAPFCGALMIAVLYEIEPIYRLQGLGTLETGEIVEIVTAIICCAVGNDKEYATSASLIVVHLVSVYLAYGMSVVIEVWGERGIARIEVENGEVTVEGDSGAKKKEEAKSNKGNTYDNTPSDNHTTTEGKLDPKGEPNSSADKVDKDGNVITRRWYDKNGNAVRDLDMTNHGNQKHIQRFHTNIRGQMV